VKELADTDIAYACASEVYEFTDGNKPIYKFLSAMSWVADKFFVDCPVELINLNRTAGRAIRVALEYFSLCSKERLATFGVVIFITSVFMCYRNRFIVKSRSLSMSSEEGTKFAKDNCVVISGCTRQNLSVVDGRGVVSARVSVDIFYPGMKLVVEIDDCVHISSVAIAIPFRVSVSGRDVVFDEIQLVADMDNGALNLLIADTTTSTPVV
jgi:hypothetical protein